MAIVVVRGHAGNHVEQANVNRTYVGGQVGTDERRWAGNGSENGLPCKAGCGSPAPQLPLHDAGVEPGSSDVMLCVFPTCST